MPSDSFFERMSKTDTYASRKFKERSRLKVKTEGRPVFIGEIDESCGGISPSESAYSKASTNSSKRSMASDGSRKSMVNSSYKARTSSASTSSTTGASVFDRLSSTGTKSYLKKSKSSDQYDSAASPKRQHPLMREFKGNTAFFGGK